MTGPTRPVLRWHGSKWRIADWVIRHFPPHLEVLWINPHASARLSRPLQQSLQGLGGSAAE
jgi:hypothetical protein